MATETPAKATLQQRATHEIKELLILTAYLYVTLGAVIAVKAAVLTPRASNSHLGASPSSRPWCWPSSYWLATP